MSSINKTWRASREELEKGSKADLTEPQEDYSQFVGRKNQSFLEESWNLAYRICSQLFSNVAAHGKSAVSKMGLDSRPG